jgi:hypothetical protein
VYENNSFTWTAVPGTHVFYTVYNWGKKPDSNFDETLEKNRGKDNPGVNNELVVTYVVVEISGNSGNFKHPGIYNSQAELDIIKANVNGDESHPMKDAWTVMLADKSNKATGKVKYSSLNWQTHEVSVVDPKSSNKHEMWDDGQAAYAHALQWVITGDQRHADKAIEIYNAWSAVFTDITTQDHDAYKNLYGSWMIHTWMAGAEIIRHYNEGAAGWAATDITEFEQMVKVFERLMLEWKGTASGYRAGHNQDAAVARTRLAIGVFLDDKALFDQGTKLLFDRKYDNNSAKPNTIRGVHGHPVNLVGLSFAKDGEVMEFNRRATKVKDENGNVTVIAGDPGHGTGTLNSMVNAAEILRHQDVPSKYQLYDLKLAIDGDTTPRLLLGSEFAANSYLNSPTKIRDNDAFVNKAHGKYSEMALNYYKNISPIAYDYNLTEEANDAFRPLSHNNYTAPWTTLTHADLSEGTQDDGDTHNAPSYCSSKGEQQSYEFIKTVQLGTINKSSTGGNGYSDFTDLSSDIIKGAVSTIKISPKWDNGYSYKEVYTVWIDFNHNGVFTDSGEKVVNIAPTKSSPASGVFNVPSSALNGKTRMRISMKYPENNNLTTNSCGTYKYGEVEDYTVNIKGSES